MKVASKVQIYLINSSEFYKRGFRMIQPQSVGTLMEKVVNSGDSFHDVSSYLYLSIYNYVKFTMSNVYTSLQIQFRCVDGVASWYSGLTAPHSPLLASVLASLSCCARANTLTVTLDQVTVATVQVMIVLLI